MPPEGKVPEFIERNFHLPYGPDAGDFRFNVMAILTVLAGVLFIATRYDAVLVIGAATASTAYYLYQQKDREKPLIGARQ